MKGEHLPLLAGPFQCGVRRVDQRRSRRAATSSGGYPANPAGPRLARAPQPPRSTCPVPSFSHLPHAAQLDLLEQLTRTALSEYH
ncbi:hypothetical protein ACFWNT_13890 [Streptomyces sp. NPDC058409]|uniref:hypothetical protein n=1 Tax=Streptomyces sp. NPDC058409 TaxID=3346484 RepID=UPI003647BA74